MPAGFRWRKTMPRYKLIPVLDPRATKAGRKLAYRCFDCGHEELHETPQAACEKCDGQVEVVGSAR